MARFFARRGRPPYPDLLTPSETRVLELIRQGKTNSEIANELAISISGVKYHVSNMLGKLGVADRQGLASWTPAAEIRRPGRPRFVALALVWPTAGMTAAVAATVIIVTVAALSGSRAGPHAAPEATSSPSGSQAVIDLTHRVPRTIDTGFGWRYAIDVVRLEGEVLTVMYHAQGDVESLKQLSRGPRGSYAMAPFSVNGVEFSLSTRDVAGSSVTLGFAGAKRTVSGQPDAVEQGDWRLTIPFK